MKVLVVAAHCDDEVLGMGGTIAFCVKRHVDVDVMILSDGCQNKSDAPARKSACHAALKYLGVNSVEILNFPDQRFDSIPLLKITQQIEKRISGHVAVYTHWHGDLNLDHAITARAVLTACRPKPDSTVKSVYGFEVASTTELGTVPFQPQHFAEIDVEKKLAALAYYNAELSHARSLAAVRAQAIKRGAECGVNHAEAFHVYRSIQCI